VSYKVAGYKMVIKPVRASGLVSGPEKSCKKNFGQMQTMSKHWRHCSHDFSLKYTCVEYCKYVVNLQNRVLQKKTSEQKHMLTTKYTYITLIYNISIQGGPKKLAPFLYTLTLPNINQFSKLFHYQNQEKICNNTITKDPTTPEVCHYSTLWNVKCLKSNNWKWQLL